MKNGYFDPGYEPDQARTPSGEEPRLAIHSETAPVDGGNAGRSRFPLPPSGVAFAEMDAREPKRPISRARLH